MGKKDPAEGLEPDITVVDDPAEREKQQLEYYGGDPIDDDEDLSNLDRGDNLDDEPSNEDRGDEVTETKEEKAEEDTEAEADEAEGDEDSDDDGDDSDDEAEVESGDDSGEEGDSDDEDAATDDDNVVEDKDKDRDPGIPRHRFNEVNERMKRAEQRLAELEAQSKAKEEAAEDKFDFDAAEKEYMDLLLDGNTDAAAAKRNEIRVAEQELFTKQATQQATSTIDEQAEMRDLNALSLQAEEMFPVFNQESDDYDPVIANKVVTYMKGYMSDGQGISDAFVSGLADVIEQYGLDDRYGRSESPDPKPAPEAKKGKPITKTKEKLAASKKAAPSPAGHGEGSAARGVSTPSISDMSDADMDKLTPEQLSRLRGDYVE